VSNQRHLRSTHRRTALGRWQFLLAALAVLGVLALLFVADPATSGLFPPCPFHAVTGLHCPGCGTLRALHQLLHGNVPAALGLNPLAVILLPVIACWLLFRLGQGMRGRSARAVILPAFWIWTLLGVIIAFWILRNVPLYPFTLLAPS
jgi:hypothetical protein